MSIDSKGSGALFFIIILSFILGGIAKVLAVASFLAKIVGIVFAGILIVVPLFSLSAESIVGKVFSIIIHIFFSVIYAFANYWIFSQLVYEPEGNGSIENFIYNLLFVAGVIILYGIWTVVTAAFTKIIELYSDM